MKTPPLKRELSFYRILKYPCLTFSITSIFCSSLMASPGTVSYTHLTYRSARLPQYPIDNIGVQPDIYLDESISDWIDYAVHYIQE